MSGDRSWLAESLAGVLGWELVAVEPIVDAIATETDDLQLEELVQVAVIGKLRRSGLA